MQKTLCITPCGKKKIWDKYPEAGPTEAAEAYISPFGRACRHYADHFYGEWVILSAKHGFLLPGDLVPENYDVGFNINHPEELGIPYLKEQAGEKQLTGYRRIVILGGKKFKPIVEAVFGPEVVYEYPLRSCKGIGLMLQKLKQAVQTNQEIKGGC